MGGQKPQSVCRTGIRTGFGLKAEIDKSLHEHTGPPVRGVVAVIEEEGRLLAIQRAAGIVAGGSWCFPGGAIEANESPEAAIVREVWEEVGLQVEAVQQLWEWHRPDGGLILSWWQARLVNSAAAGCPNPSEVAEMRWVTPDEMRGLTPLLPSNLAFLDRHYPAGGFKPGAYS